MKNSSSKFLQAIQFTVLTKYISSQAIANNKSLKLKLVFTLALAILISAVQMPVYAANTPPGNYKIDPNHSSVLFKVSHLGLSNLLGRFNVFSGNFTHDATGKPKVKFTIQVKSVDTNHQKRDAHLRGPDFFNAKIFKTIRFESNEVKLNQSKQPIELRGKLSLHGKTKQVIFNIKTIGAGKDPWGGFRVGYTANTSIKRSDFGMKFMPNGVGDKIEITVHIEAIKQK